MIVSFFYRLVRYIAILGVFVYIISPGISFFRGNGFVINKYDWIIVIPYGIFVLINEIRRYRKSRPKKEIDF